jgi:hypothetical protein
VRTLPVILVDIVQKTSVAFVAGTVAKAVGPFAGEGLDEAFGLTVGLRPVRAGEEVFDPEFAAGRGEGFGSVGGAVVGEDGADP